MNLARGEVDRDGISRADMSLRYSSQARFIVLYAGQIAVRSGVPAFFEGEEILQLFGEKARDNAMYLGRCTDRERQERYFCVDVDEVPQGVECASIRYNAHMWDAFSSTLAAEAIALVNWYRTVNFCERCGENLISGPDAWHRTCASGHLIFPRTDPAVIMAITDSQDRLLLAHNCAWSERKVSVLAGYVDAGEPAEETVAREAYEETGIQVENIRFFASQPWPFPRSLMLAFEATTKCSDVDIRVDGEEIEWARFYTREEFRNAVASGEIETPTLTSAAAALVARWLERGENSEKSESQR